MKTGKERESKMSDDLLALVCEEEIDKQLVHSATERRKELVFLFYLIPLQFSKFSLYRLANFCGSKLFSEKGRQNSRIHQKNDSNHNSFLATSFYITTVVV